MIKKLKTGGQKEVYLIEHSKYGICILKKGKCSSLNSLERIKREVFILKEINSCYFPKNYEANFYDNGEFNIFEEYIESDSLSDIMDIYKGNENKVLRLLLSLIDGLKILWDKRIVHRDLKPDNILIKSNGEPVIIDLGIVRALDEKSLTLTVQLNGPCTPIYAAPEQIRNRKSSIDVRTDFFSLGIIVTELILGKHPFSIDVTNVGMSIVDNILNGRYKLEYDGIYLSNKLQNIVRKLLQPEPYQRIRTYSQLEGEIINLLKGDK